MNKLANQFKGKFKCLEENTEKYKSFSVPIENQIKKIYKDGNRILQLSYKKKIINRAGFMASSLSNFVDNLAEGICKIKCKDCNSFLEYEIVNDKLIK